MDNIFGQTGVNVKPINPKVVHRSGMGDKETSPTNILTLMVKKYEKGELTKKLIDSDHNNSKLQLSCSRGEGLHFG